MSEDALSQPHRGANRAGPAPAQETVWSRARDSFLLLPELPRLASHLQTTPLSPHRRGQSIGRPPTRHRLPARR